MAGSSRSMGGHDWMRVTGAWDVPPGRLDRELYLGAYSDTHPDERTRRGPQAYLVVQGAATAMLPVHFHTCDQFQYFVDGEGTVGTHHVGGGTVHYSDALQPYGPLRPGAPGMSYLTLRAEHDGGVRYMPESSHELAGLLAAGSRSPRDRRNVAVDLAGPDHAAGWRHLVAEPDGLRVSICDLAPGEAAEDCVVRGSGAYAVVVRGAVGSNGGGRGRGALCWVAAGDVLAVDAGPDGARVALLQFP